MRTLVFHACRFAVVLLLLVGCHRRETSVEIGNREQIFHLGNGSEPRDLDPHTAVSVTESNILCSLFEGLVSYTPDGHGILPGAAERWDISPDGRIYTFHLRPGLKWNNGDGLTSADFLYSFRRIIEPKLGGELSIYCDWVVGAQDYREGRTHDFAAVGFAAPDPLTFVTTLKDRAPFWLALLAQNPFYPVHRATLEKHDAYLRRDGAWTRPGVLVSNGPFMLKDWRVNEFVATEKNPRYWDAAHVRLARVVFHPIDDLDAEERAFRGGLLHATRYLAVTKLESYRKDHPDFVHSDPLVMTKYVSFNVTRPPFTDARVRRAFALAVDREAIVRDVLRDGSRVADSFTVPGTGISAPYTAHTHLAHDPEKARALLAAAGFPAGKGFPPMTMNFTTAHQGEQALVEALQAMWQQELGVHVNLITQEERVWLDTLRTRNFQMLMDAWTGINDPVDLLQLMLSTSPNNDAQWVSPDYDREFAAAGSAPDDAARETHLQAMDALLLDQLPVIPLYHQNQNYLVLPVLHGWVDNLLGWRRFQDYSLTASGK